MDNPIQEINTSRRSVATLERAKKLKILVVDD